MKNKEKESNIIRKNTEVYKFHMICLESSSKKQQKSWKNSKKSWKNQKMKEIEFFNKKNTMKKIMQSKSKFLELTLMTEVN